VNNLKALVLVVAALALPIAANAQVAYTAKTVHLRAGPARDYPVVAILESGVAVTVQGCMQDYSWCDVIAGLDRGWVYAGNIVYAYQGANVPVISYGAVIGIGVITFVIGSYWQDHYVGRPWYRHMPHWSHRPPRAAIHPGPPHAPAHPGGARHPVPAYRTPPSPPGAGVTPRQPHAGAHPGARPRPAPADRPVPVPPSAGAHPRPPQTGAQPGRVQRPMPGAPQAPRPRP